MSNKMTIKYLSQEALLKAGCLDMPHAISVVEKALTAYENDRVLYPDKTVQIFDEQLQSRINCLPATLLDEKVCGMKWVSVFPGNPQMFGLQNLSAVLLLSSIETGFPIAFMEGTLCSNLRTAAVSATGAKYLARPDSAEIGFIGAGEQAKMHLVGMKAVLPQLKVCRVSSRTEAREQEFIAQMSPLFPDLEFIPCHSSYEKAAVGADVIVTAISGQAPLLHGAWCKKGAFYCHVAGWEDDDETALKADKIVCDSWSVVKHRTQTISRLYKAGKLKDEDIYADLVDLIAGRKPGRERDDEFIYFNAVGLSFVDVAMGYDLFKRAEPYATILPLQEDSIFCHDFSGTSFSSQTT
jgi:ornithine cyclodeaminase/alanine dehydrogenase-like protein (mu-crystallin family)